MTYSTVKMEINPDKLWSDMPTGAKVAGGIVAVALIGASLVASVFLAAAAMFGALVMMVYGALARKGKSRKEAEVEEELNSDMRVEVHGEVVKSES